MGDLDSTIQHYLGEITQAQFVSKSPTHDQEDKVSWILKKVEGAAAPLIEASTAVSTLKSSVAQSCSPFQEGCTWRFALGTLHHFHPLFRATSVSSKEVEQ